MTTSGIEESAMQLLEAFHDLARGRLKEPVTLGDAKREARMDSAPAASTEPDVAVGYLVNQGYVEVAGTGQVYAITVPGMDRVRQRRGLESTTNEGSNMSDKTQRLLVTGLAIGLSQVLARPLTRFIGEQIPERRGIKDDVTEAVLKGSTRMAAFLIASILVRKLASR